MTLAIESSFAIVGFSGLMQLWIMYVLRFIIPMLVECKTPCTMMSCLDKVIAMMLICDH